MIETGSKDFEKLVSLLGEKVRLKGWDKYRGGLDVKGDMTGRQSVYTIYEGHEIMFHVSTLLPYSKDNRQQVSSLCSPRSLSSTQRRGEVCLRRVRLCLVSWFTVYTLLPFHGFAPCTSCIGALLVGGLAGLEGAVTTPSFRILQPDYTRRCVPLERGTMWEISGRLRFESTEDTWYSARSFSSAPWPPVTSWGVMHLVCETVASGTMDPLLWANRECERVRWRSGLSLSLFQSLAYGSGITKPMGRLACTENLLFLSRGSFSEPEINGACQRRVVSVYSTVSFFIYIIRPQELHWVNWSARVLEMFPVWIVCEGVTVSVILFLVTIK